MFTTSVALQMLVMPCTLLTMLATTVTASQLPVHAHQREAIVYFSDDFENGLANWAVSGLDWDLTTTTYTSAVHSLTDSPNGSYVPNANASATLAQSLDLSHATDPKLTFWHRYAMDEDYYKNDRAYLEISTDGGLSWPTVLESWNYRISTWSFVQVDLSAYKGTHVKIRFRLYSDNDGYLGDGWYVDDVMIQERDAMRTPFPFFEDFEAGTGNWLVSGNDWLDTDADARAGSKSLTDSVSDDYAAYTSASVTLAHPIDLSASIQPVLTFWNRYALDEDYYKNDTLYVQVSMDGGETWSTLSSKNYRVSTWHHVQIDLSAYKASAVKVRFHLYSDSDGYLGDGWYIDDVAIQEYADLDKDIAFPFQDDFEGGMGDWLLSGQHWGLTDLDRASGTYSLTDSTDASYGAYASARATLDGTLDLTNTDQPVLTFWHRYAMDEDYYKNDRVYVQVSTDGGFTWATLQDWNYRVSTWFFVQADLSAYKAAEVKVRFLLYSDSDGYLGDGWHIDDVAIEEYRDLNPQLSFPFTEDFEDTLDDWLLSGRHWEATATQHVSGTQSLTDSPGVNYGSYASVRATLDGTLDLTNTVQPVLSFWHRYAMDEDYYKNDRVYAQVSTDGGFSWETLESWNYRVSTWFFVQADLSAYKAPEVKVRFLLNSDSDGYLGDGWYLDDVAILELEDLVPTLTYPFTENFESGTSQWRLSDQHWVPTRETSVSPSHSLTDSPGSNYLPYSSARATLAGTVDLSTASFPVLKFWHWYHLDDDYYKNDRVYVQISTDLGFSWSTLESWNGRISNWVLEQIDLSPYTGQKVQVRFLLNSDSDGYLGDGWHIDDVRIEEL